MATQQKQIAQQFHLRDLWSAPLSYDDVRALAAAYQTRNAKSRRPNTGFLASLPWTALVIALLFSAVLMLVYMLLMMRRQASPAPAGTATAAAGTSADPDAAENLLRFGRLTKREREVLCMICRGLSSKIIADELGISVKTVEFHRANLLQKTKAGTTPHLVQLATQLGFDESNGLAPR